MVLIQDGSVVSLREVMMGELIDAKNKPIKFDLADNKLSGSATVENEDKSTTIYTFDLANAQVVVRVTTKERPEEGAKPLAPEEEEEDNNQPKHSSSKSKSSIR